MSTFLIGIIVGWLLGAIVATCLMWGGDGR